MLHKCFLWRKTIVACPWSLYWSNKKTLLALCDPCWLLFTNQHTVWHDNGWLEAALCHCSSPWGKGAKPLSSSNCHRWPVDWWTPDSTHRITHRHIGALSLRGDSDGCVSLRLISRHLNPWPFIHRCFCLGWSIPLTPDYPIYWPMTPTLRIPGLRLIQWGSSFEGRRTIPHDLMFLMTEVCLFIM